MRAEFTKPTVDPLEVRLYHITHIRNLASILEQGMLPLNELNRRCLKPHSIAFEHLQRRRDGISVSFPPSGPLHDYVPWSFAARSPMLFSARRGALGLGVLQTDIIHLVTNVRQVEKLKLNAVFTDGHPISTDLTTYSNDLSLLPSMLDWDVLKARMWHNTELDGDRKRRRQAEFLIHGIVPWQIVRGIAVHNLAVYRAVVSIVGNSEHRPAIKIVPEWYY